jgi:hypothetical protein
MNKTDLDNYINSKIYTNVTEDITGNKLQEVLRTINASVENNSNKGIANGYAPLNGSTKIDASYLPSYVDDVIEVANYAALPVTGETGKIYITINTSLLYRWSGTVYVQVGGSDPVWGTILGTLSSQTDLQAALDAKLDDPNGTSAQYIKGDGTLGTSVSGTVTSVGLTMPSAFTVSNSPITSSGAIAVTGAGVASQYVRGDGQLATLPTSTGGGSALSYYLNGSVSQGTIGGNTYYEMSRNPVIGTGTDFTISADGVIARFITDVGDPGLLSVPSGNWNLEFFFQSSSSGGTPSFYVNIYKYSAITSTFTLLGTNSTAPEAITNGTLIDAYFTPVTIPTTTLNIGDRLAIEIYVNHSSKTIKLHTEDSHLCQIITNFSTGLNALNGLTAQVQYLATGTTGSDFAINSVDDTHTFNLPVASATNTGKLSSSNWSTFNGKQDLLVSGTNIQTINGNNILTSGNLVLSTAKDREHDFASPYDYLGYAVAGTPTSSTGWTITRLTISSDGSSVVEHASGIWDNRASLTYI